MFPLPSNNTPERTSHQVATKLVLNPGSKISLKIKSLRSAPAGIGEPPPDHSPNSFRQGFALGVPSGYFPSGEPSLFDSGLNPAPVLLNNAKYVLLTCASFDGHSILPGSVPIVTQSATQPTSVTAPSRTQSKLPLHIRSLFRSAWFDSPMKICRRLFLHVAARPLSAPT